MIVGAVLDLAQRTAELRHRLAAPAEVLDDLLMPSLLVGVFAALLAPDWW